jgi:hypothetical protein
LATPKVPLSSTIKARKPPRFQVPFTRKNYMVLGIGLAVLIVGYLCLSQGPQDGFLSLTLAPILLVLGYCIIIPYGIMVRDKNVVAGSNSGGD